MATLEHEITITASAERIWAVLTDFASYAQWNPFILQAQGEARVGTDIVLTMQAPGHGVTRVRSKIVVVTPRRELRWRGHLFLPGVFDVEHVFQIEPMDAKLVRLRQYEQIHGVLVPFVRSILQDSEKGFAAMNEALKMRTES